MISRLDDSRLEASKGWATWDIESTEWVNFRVAAVYDGEKTFICWSPEEIVDTFDLLAGEGRVFWAHYGGKFDIKFILPTLIQRHQCAFSVVSGGLVRIKCYQGKRKLYEIRDSFNILPVGLEKLTKTFKIETTITPEKLAYYKAMRDRIGELSDQEIEEYVGADCVALHRILLAAREKFQVNDFKMTIASQAWSNWREGQDERLYRSAARHYDIIRAAYYGGRTEVFTRHGYGLNYYDVRSMYPFVMWRYQYPGGYTKATLSRESGFLGVFTVEVQAPPGLKYPFLPYRASDGKLLFPLGQWVGTYTSVELDYAESLGYKFRVLDGLIWSERLAPFKEYVEKWYAIKAEAKKAGDTALEFVAKHNLNDLYGKFGQRREFKKVIMGGITRDIIKKSPEDLFPELGLYTIVQEEKKPFCYTQVAAFVTAYARIRLYEGFREIEAQGKEVYYCDTDSIVTDGVLAEWEELGGWDRQAILKEGIFLLPKVYAATLESGEHMLKAKGFRHDDLDIKAYRAALEGDYTKFRSAREGIMGLYEAARRSSAILTRSLLVRTLSGKFDKRIVAGDKIHTTPKVI